MRNIVNDSIIKVIAELFNKIRGNSADSLVKKLKPFFDFIQKRILKDIDWKEQFLYSTLPIWSYKENKFPDGYPGWYRDKDSKKLYLKLYEIFKNPNFYFSFVRFVSHQIRRIPNVLVIELVSEDNKNKGSQCTVRNDEICEFRLRFYVNEKIRSHFNKKDNIIWTKGYDGMPKDIKQAYNNFVKGITKCSINNTPFLQVVDKNKENELFFGLFKFLYAYATVFKDKIKTLYIFPGKVYKTSKGYDLGYGCFIVAANQLNIFDDDRKKAISLVMNLVYSSLAISDWADFRNYKESLTAIKSAIGSIMSNMYCVNRENEKTFFWGR